MRFLGFLVFLGGIALSFGPTEWLDGWFSREIIRERVHSGEGFTPVSVALSPAMAPVAILIEMRERGAYDPADGAAALAVVATQNGKQAFATAVNFTAEDRGIDPQGIAVYSKQIGRVAELTNAEYRFVVSEGDAEPIDIEAVDIVLLANAFAAKPDFGFYGNIAIWLGVAMFVIGLRRRRNAAAEAPPPAPKWGRDGG